MIILPPHHHVRPQRPRELLVAILTIVCLDISSIQESLAQSPLTTSEQTFSATVAGAVQAARKKYRLPAVGALVFDIDGNTLAQHVDGTLRADEATSIAADSLWHIGSNTKAITATLAALLVEQGVISFDTTVADVLPSIIVDRHGAAADITLGHLLNHTAGLPPNPPRAEKKRVLGVSRNYRVQRFEVARWALSKKPLTKPGGSYLYSNAGYIVAGSMLEEAARKSWEQMVDEQVFQPLGISAATGFGPPKGKQPEGHRHVPNDAENPYVAVGQNSDNPAFYGPAGTVHMSLGAWKAFALDHLREGKNPSSSLLKPASYRRLHSPSAGRKNYAFGWGMLERGKGIQPILVHNGSNTQWYARILLDREIGVGILLVANAGTEDARQALDQIAKTINDTLFGKK